MNTIIPNHGPALNYEQLADLYPGRARILPLETVYQWAKKQTDIIYCDPIETTLHLIIKDNI